jgi:DNA-binding NtrC family response regulator
MTAKKRILFVDDEPAILAGLRAVFHRDRTRWDMVFAQGGAAALEHLRDGVFDVVISDKRMPGIDGLELLAQIHAASPETRLIMLSGSSDEELEAARATVDELLGKPCDARTLRAAIEAALDRRRVEEVV